MKVDIIVLTYNRPNVLSACIQTLFNNAQYPINQATILDDGSSPQIQNSLLKFAQDNSNGPFPIHFFANGKNLGIGYQFERAFNIMRYSEADVVCLIESDYVWRAGWLKDVVSVFEASPKTLAIAGCNHPDMYDRAKTHGVFVQLMKDQFNRDIPNRNKLYIPFELNGIKVQGVSNSCGCKMVHWGRLKKLLRKNNLESRYWNWMDRAFNKQEGGDRRHASDAHMSGTISYYGTMCQALQENEFAFLDICDYSISQHVCGGGANGMIVPEGSTFICSPNWKDEYMRTNPRESK